MKKPQEVTNGEIANSRLLLQNPYAHLNDTGDYDAVFPMQETIPHTNSTQHRKTARQNVQASCVRAERAARNLHQTIWMRRHEFWPDGVPSDPVKLIDPRIAVQCIGFEYDLSEYLGEFHTQGASREVAGIIDRNAKRISISRRLPYNTHRFTAAHEIGHAILHRETIMHRDRPIDGSSQKQAAREFIEFEADKFASYFLMPEKLVRKHFKQLFGAGVFSLNDDTAFALDPTNPEGLIKQCKSPRDIARLLARTERYNRRNVYSLASQFGVSIEAMAIRIEELGLIEI